MVGVKFDAAKAASFIGGRTEGGVGHLLGARSPSSARHNHHHRHNQTSRHQIAWHQPEASSPEVPFAWLQANPFSWLQRLFHGR